MHQFANPFWMMFGLDLLVKMTLLMLLAIVVDRMLVRQSAAARHCLWVASFVGLLLLPLAIWMAPGFRLNIWPAQWTQTDASDQLQSNSDPIHPTPLDSESHRLLSAQPIPQEQLSAERRSTQPSLEYRQFESINGMHGSEATPTSSVLHRSVRWSICVWAVGIVLALSPLLLGFWRNFSLRRISKKTQDQLLLGRFEQLCNQLGIGRSVELRELDKSIIPLTWGLIRPVILLPIASERLWTAERQHIVLLHELAHVKRFDVLWQVMARVACGLYWFHPLVWYANRRLRTERELACDDCVLVNGIKSSSYAEQLLQLAREYQSCTLSAAAVAMAQRSGLERRVRSVLDHTISRLPVSRRSVALLLTVFAAIAFILAIPKLDSVAISQEGKPAVQQDQSSQTSKPNSGSGHPQQKVEVAPDELVGIVVDEQGLPLTDVLVDAWSWFPGNETKTDAEGRFRLKFDDASRKVEIRFIKDGYSPFYKPRQPLGVRNFKVTLSQRTFIEGVVRDSNGKPAANVEVRGEQGMQQADGGMIGFVATTTKTDGDGRYRLFVHPDTYQLLVRTPSGQTARLTDIVVREHEGKQQDIDLQPGVRFEANVVNSLTGKPLSGLVLWHWMYPDLIGKSDSEGNLVIEGMLPGDFEFRIGEGESQKLGPVTGYLPRNISRWWSPEAKHPHQREEIRPGKFQRNLDGLNFDIAQGMDSVTIFVEPGVTFRGRVTDPEGNPVEGATVSPAKTGSGNSLTGDTRYSVKTDAEGRYEVVMPAGKEFQYNLIAHDGDYQQWRKWANGVTEPLRTQPGEKHQIDIQLTRPATVRGRVVAEDGRQVAGRQVRAHAKDLRENRYYDPTARTKDDGTFELKFIRPGEHWIQVEPFYLSAAEAPSGSISVALAEGEIHEDVELKVTAQ